MDDILRIAPVIPVLTIKDVRDARPLAETLVAGGLCVIEVTLRTPTAFEAIREMRDVKGAIIGAGTVLNRAQFDASLEAGAQFVVSPGFTKDLVLAARARNANLLSGVATASEIMRGLDLGHSTFKFFPAEAAGGAKALKLLAAPFGAVRFCPTGGVTAVNAADYLALENVLCVGGSWIVPAGPLDRVVIGKNARQAAMLRR
jgi:2-dehydro-3-deoxyphosphogluconate aldolase/(4S)-4-hydroxy-2-oxoglutarate aldolase